MIYPGNRLLIWMALLLPFSATCALIPSSAIISMTVLGAFALLVLSDAIGTKFFGSKISLSLPPVVRLARMRSGTISIQTHNPTPKELTIKVGLPLPLSFVCDTDEMTIHLPAGQRDGHVDWTCKPKKRGRYQLNEIYVEQPSPLAFWNIRHKIPTTCELRVYPDLVDEKKRFASLFLHRGIFGVHAHRMIGQGREFEKLREYIPGDSYEDIHWKATAKRQRPITKLFQIERTQEVYMLIDTARLSGRVVGREAVLERYISASMVVGLAAEQQGDLFGMIPFSDRLDHFVRAGAGKAHHRACRDIL